VGARRALLEANVRPDLLTGTSVGAVNAIYLALHGFTTEGLDDLEEAWRDAVEANLLPSNYLWLGARALFNRAGLRPYHHFRDFFTAHDLDPAARFGELTGPRLVVVATDLARRCLTLYGEDRSQSILEGLLSSTALPPWVRPLKVGEDYLMDGGTVSNLAIEPALRNGATEIVALGLFDPWVESEMPRLRPFLSWLPVTVEQHQIDLEMRLAREARVPVPSINWPSKGAHRAHVGLHPGGGAHCPRLFDRPAYNSGLAVPRLPPPGKMVDTFLTASRILEKLVVRG